MSRNIIYRGEEVSKNTELASLLQSKEPDADKKAIQHWKMLHAQFMAQHKGYEHMLNFKIGQSDFLKM
jgi:hypothetical protein